MSTGFLNQVIRGYGHWGWAKGSGKTALFYGSGKVETGQASSAWHGPEGNPFTVSGKRFGDIKPRREEYTIAAFGLPSLR